MIQAQRRGVRGGDPRGHRVGVHGVHENAVGSRRQGVGAQPAPQIGHGPDPGGREARRPALGHHRSRRLLEPGAGEEHPAGRRAELRGRAAAQIDLRQRGRGQLRSDAAGPQRRGRGERVAGRHLIGRGQRIHPFGGTQKGENIGGHHGILPGVPTLALWLTEC